MAKKTTKGRIIGLDALRCFAIILVVVYHLFPTIFPGGFLAVDVFFAISGFLIVKKLIRTRKKEKEDFGGFKSFFKFLIQRLVRFLPTLLFCMIITLSLAYFADPDLLTAARPNSLYAITFSTNIMSIVNGTTYESSLIPNFFNQTWFLALELQVCLICFLALVGYFQYFPIDKSKIIKKRYKGLRIFLITIAVISFILMAIYGGWFKMFDRAYFGPDSHIGAFFAGGALALSTFIKRIWPAKKKKRWVWISLLVLSLGGVVAMVPFINYASPETFVVGLPTVTILSLVMIVSVLKLQNPFKKTVSRPIRILEYIGSLSFGIYLLHYGLYVLLPNLMNFWPYEAVAVVVIIASILLSILLYKVLMPFSVKHKVWFTIILVASLVLPVMSLVKAPEKSSIEESLNVVAEEVVEEESSSEANVAVDYSGMVEFANLLNNDVMKFFDATTSFAKPYPVAINGGGITYSLSGRAYYNTPNYSRVSALSSARVMVLGDSVVVGATNAIYNTVPGAFVDALQSRNMTDAINLLAGYRAANGGNLPYIIVIGLVTNYVNFGVDTLRTIMDTAGPGHQFVFITGYCGDYPRDAQNNVIKYVANNYANAHVADWVPVVAPNVNSYTYADHIHLTPAGRQAYANLINGVVSGL